MYKARVNPNGASLQSKTRETTAQLKSHTRESSNNNASSHEKQHILFGVDTRSSHDVEDDEFAFANVIKYTILALICLMSFLIRLFAVVRYESVIHEFDPYFNYRTTKYLSAKRFLEFLVWFDDRAWYPLGRIIGGTIYPGLMWTGAVFYWVLNFFNLSINVCNNGPHWRRIC